MTANILETKNLSKDFGTLKAVQNVDFHLKKGELHSIIGPNGAGKTTFFNLLTGNLRCSQGNITFKGQDITNLPAHKRSHLGIGRSFQQTNIFPRLSTLENVRIAAQSRKKRLGFWEDGLKDNSLITKAMNILEQVKLSDSCNIQAGTLSYGQQRYLEIGISLSTDPELLLLDEPTAGLSPDESSQVAEFIKSLAKTITILLVEHDMEIVMGISDVITVLHNGSLLCKGTPKEIRCNPEVQKVYLREEVC